MPALCSSFMVLPFHTFMSTRYASMDTDRCLEEQMRSHRLRYATADFATNLTKIKSESRLSNNSQLGGLSNAELI